MSTIIGRLQDGLGNELAGGETAEDVAATAGAQARKYQSNAERNLGHGCTEISRIVGLLEGYVGIIEQASVIFRTAQR